jgi:uncharacterized protein with LGFP repeats
MTSLIRKSITYSALLPLSVVLLTAAKQSRVSSLSLAPQLHIVLPGFTSAQTEIQQKYSDLGGEGGFLGKPTMGLGTCPDGIGYFVHYQGGSIYWTPSTGAHEIHGAIREKWKSIGWEQSALGYPVTDESVTPDRIGRYNHFQHGSIYWTPSTDAHEIHGAIREKWKSMGWELSQLGYPVTDESLTPDGVGRYNHFQNGSIYWTPSTNAHEIHGAIKAKWASMGWETSYLGYPLSDVDNNTSQFQRGSIQVTSNGVAVDYPKSKHFHARVSFDDSTPIGGDADLIVDAKGNFHWFGYLHDSSRFVSYHCRLAVAVIAGPRDQSPLTYSKWVEETASFGDNHWDFAGNDQWVAEHWDQIDQTGAMYWRIESHDTFSEAVGDFIKDLVKEAIKKYLGA